MSSTNSRHSLIRFGPSAAIAILTLTLAAGCKPHSDGDGHDHGSKPAKHDEHNHGSGEAEHADEVTLTADAVGHYGIKVEPAQLWALRPTLIAPARVSFNAEAMAHVGSPLRGRATDIKAKLGDTIKRGDVLLVIESPELGEAQADYLLKRVASQSSEPAVELSKVAWERAKGLYEQSQGISLTEVQKREVEYKAALATQKAADAATAAAASRLSLLGMEPSAIDHLAKTGEIKPMHTILSPIDGQVVEREVTLGELVNPDRESLMVLADTSTMWVLVDVPEARLHEVAVGAKAWIAAAGTASGKFEGQVGFIAPMVDAATRTVQVRIEVPAALMAIKPGMFAQAEIVATDPARPEPAPVVAVPGEAVQTVEGGPAIFVPVKGEPNTFAKRAVKVGPAIGGLVPIYAGLVEGEEYVTAGTFILKAELGKGSAAHEH